jgi:hypothetical protein
MPDAKKIPAPKFATGENNSDLYPNVTSTDQPTRMVHPSRLRQNALIWQAQACVERLVARFS